MSKQTVKNRRVYTRIRLNTSLVFYYRENAYVCELRDISFDGVLVHCPIADLPIVRQEKVKAELRVPGDEDTYRLVLEFIHRDDYFYGFRFDNVDSTLISLISRIMRDNDVDDQLIKKEIHLRKNSVRNRRVYTRLTCQFMVDFNFKEEHADVDMKDLSLNGALLQMPTALLAMHNDDTATASFSVPKNATPVEVEMRLVHKKNFDFGFQFIGLNDESKRKIMRIMLDNDVESDQIDFELYFLEHYGK